jgi:hypothetical protein
MTPFFAGHPTEGIDPLCPTCEDMGVIWVGRWAPCPCCTPIDDDHELETLDLEVTDTSDHTPAEPVSATDRAWWQAMTRGEDSEADWVAGMLDEDREWRLAEFQRDWLASIEAREERVG